MWPLDQITERQTRRRAARVSAVVAEMCAAASADTVETVQMLARADAAQQREILDAHRRRHFKRVTATQIALSRGN